MFFWWYMLVSVLICPLSMIFSGWVMWKCCAKGQPGAVGYRTRRSLASVKAWQFANEDCGKRLWRWGWLLLPANALSMLLVGRAAMDTVAVLGGVLCMLDCLIMILLIFPTEKSLKRYFE